MKTEMMKNLIDSIAKEIIAEKKSKNISPPCASTTEIQHRLARNDAVKQCMRALVIEGRYVGHVDINGTPQLWPVE